MTMTMLAPITVTPAMLTSDVPITETAWTAGTYSTGTVRYVGIDLYEVVAAPNTTDEPVTGSLLDPPSWIKIGVINRYRMFDLVIGDATVQTADAINLEIVPGQMVNGIAFFNVAAQSIQVTVTDPVAGLVYDTTRSLSSPDGFGSWYKYFFTRASREDTAVFFDLPRYRDATIGVTVINETGADAAVGEIALGSFQILGTTLLHFTFGIEDFSRKERDDFGRFVITERGFAKTASFDVFLRNGQVNPTFRALAAQRAKPTVYVGDDNRPETVILGFYKDFTTLRTGPESSEMTLEIEGLV